MAVRVEDRYRNGGGKMRVLMACNKLAVYTTNITDNPNKFNPVHGRIIDRITGTATEIYYTARAANEIRVVDRHTRMERRVNQKRALQLCGRLTTDICIAQGVFHLPAKRVRHWDSLVEDAAILLQAWIRAEDLQYSKYPLINE